MRAVCLVDTSVFVEVLNVPHLANQHGAVTQQLAEKISNKEWLFLPMATVLETGNHIAQNGDGNLRRQCAERFVKQVNLAIDGESPFTPINFLEANDLRKWLTQFPNWAMQGQGLGDLSILHDWERLCEQNQARRVYIWSLDQHLSGYDTGER